MKRPIIVKSTLVASSNTFKDGRTASNNVVAKKANGIAKEIGQLFKQHFHGVIFAR